ncbi:fibroblast growth factor receptor 2 isoform X1 [Folsomia candida]|uniref:fibroblast growth factor receptor 2 isoform X1 n=1 Tax=Folsomia candida TaxID=158441 RepID=UPI001604C36F|nr:fibroblast growth factor receptor 2 isoform X1 [Folsomia candida]
MLRFFFLILHLTNCFLTCSANNGNEIDSSFTFVPIIIPTLKPLGLDEPYVNKYCNENFPPGYVYYGCCSEKHKKSHCFLNDHRSRDAFCETQTLHDNRFSFNCTKSLLDKNCTLPWGTCYCCSADPLTNSGGGAPDPPQSVNLTDPSLCGTIRTNYFFGGNHTLVYVREQTGYELPLFGSISYALKGGRKFVDVMNPNCRISVCHTFKQYDAECLHFTNGGRNSYTTDQDLETVSISCGCLNGPHATNDCTKPDDIVQSDVTTCLPQNLDGDTCAILYQEFGCQSCLYDEIRLHENRSSFNPSNFAVVRSLRVNSGCTVRASTDQDFVEFNGTTSILPEFFIRSVMNDSVYSPFNSYDCVCGPKTIIEEGEVSFSGGAIAAIAVGLVVLAAAVAGLAYFMRGRKPKVKFTPEEIEQLKKELFGWSEAPICNHIGPEVDVPIVGSTNNGINEEYSVKKEDIEVFKNTVLGRGNYGVIFKGSLSSQFDQDKVDCAIKTVDEFTARMDDLKLLMNEIRIMSCLGRHENVIAFLGFYCNFHPTKWEFLCLMELCTENLHSYLHQARNCLEASYSAKINAHMQKAGYVLYADAPEPGTLTSPLPPPDAPHVTITEREMRKWSAEIAHGMNYLTMKNVWLSMKWSALESLMGLKFSKESDIWSYGVTLWEIFSLGEEPYPEMGEMVDLIRFLNMGHRLQCPKSCDHETYTLMRRCWEMDPTKRPTFLEIGIFFENAERKQISF